MAVAAAVAVGIGLLLVGAVWVIPVALFLVLLPLLGMAIIKRVRGMGVARGVEPLGVPTTSQASYDPKVEPHV